MPIQYPDFRADPNAVPQLKGLPTFVESLQKGYQMAQLPEQMRMQRAMQQQQLQKGAMENYYYPQAQEQQLAQSRAATQGQLLQNQYLPQDEASKQALSQAQTNLYATQNRLAPGTAASENAQRAAESNYYDAQTKGFAGKNQAQIDELNAEANLANAKANQANNPQTEDVYQKSFQTQQGKDASAALGQYTKELSSAKQVQTNLSQLASIVEQPGFDQAVGPVNKWINKAGLGPEQAQQISGNLAPYLGSIQGQIANSVSGNAARAKLYFAAMQKPDMSDPADLFRGKMEAANTLNKWNIDYYTALTRNIQNGMRPNEAVIQADKDVPYDKYQGEMDLYLKNGTAANKYKGDDYKDKGYTVFYAPDKSGKADGSIAYVTLPAKDGGTVTIPAQNVDKYLAKYGD